MVDKEIVYYSDGEIEDVLLETLGKGEDVFSIPYNGGAVFHNFTDARENLISWFPFLENASVLEIGAGMGALTGLLCQKCRNVVALEHSPKRAEIIRKRHNKYTNLEVISGDIFTYEFTQKYDYILLIGVLEYMGINSQLDNPYTAVLKRVHSLLNENGTLLLAIENRFGLKYWCGVKTSTSFRILDISLLYAPAFIATDAPTHPGIPVENSIPVNPFSMVSNDNLISKHPASADTRLLLYVILFSLSNFIITPSK